MNLVKETWQKKDIEEFQEYLKTFNNPSKLEWSKNILQTNMPLLCMKTADMKNIIKEISKGNYIEFLNYMVWEYYENTVINGSLICLIKDFDTMKKYLDIYSSMADNWATCDLLSFNVKGKELEYLNLSKEYIKSSKPFVRRIGMYILFNYIDDKNMDMIFKTLDKFTNEENYYVNMMNAWLLSDCIIKQRDKSLEYLKNHKLNKFTINKGIQKCRDSRRLTQEEKDMLLKFKVK